MAKSTVAVRFTGDTADLKRSLGQVEGGFGKMSGRAKVALAAAGTALVAFAGTSVKAYAEAEKAQANLDAAFAKFPQLAGKNADALRELNTELSKKTAYDDDATASAQALLAQFGLTEEQLREITPLVQDFAARTGQDLTSAASSVGKAILGQGRALKTVGIDFQDTGTKAGNFQAIVEGLDEKVGGAAETMGDTAAGKAAILSNQFGELQEKVGGALIPALSKLADVGLGVIEFIDNLNGPAKTAIGVAAGLAVALLGVSAAVGQFRKVQNNLSGLTGSLKSAEGGTTRLGKAAGALPLVGVAVGIAAWGQSVDGFKFKAEAATKSIDAMTDAELEQVDKMLELAAATGDLDTVIGNVADTSVPAAERLLDYAEANGFTKGKVAELRQVIEDKRSSDVQGAKDQAAYSTEVNAAATATDGLTGELIAEEEALQGVLDATLAQFDHNLQYRQSVDGVSDAMRDLAKARQDEGAQSEAYTDQLLTTEDAILRQAAAAVTMAEDTAAGFGVTLSAQDKQRVYREELIKVRDTLGPGSPLRAAIDGYIAKLDAIPPKKKTDVGVNGVEAARAKVDGLIRRLNDFDQMFSTANVQVMGGNPSQGGIPRFAEGGVMPGPRGKHSLAMVAGGETILPTHKGGAVTTAAAVVNVTIAPNISVPPTMDAGAAGQAITEALAAYIRRNGANDLRRLLGV